MIIYGLLKAIMFVLSIVANLLGGLIPSFPSAISSVLSTISIMLQGGISFVSYFFYVPVVVALISLVISWHSFRLMKDALMKVVGHFFGN